MTRNFVVLLFCLFQIGFTQSNVELRLVVEYRYNTRFYPIDGSHNRVTKIPYARLELINHSNDSLFVRNYFFSNYFPFGVRSFHKLIKSIEPSEVSKKKDKCSYFLNLNHMDFSEEKNNCISYQDLSIIDGLYVSLFNEKIKSLDNTLQDKEGISTVLQLKNRHFFSELFTGGMVPNRYEYIKNQLTEEVIKKEQTIYCIDLITRDKFKCTSEEKRNELSGALIDFIYLNPKETRVVGYQNLEPLFYLSGVVNIQYYWLEDCKADKNVIWDSTIPEKIGNYTRYEFINCGFKSNEVELKL